MSKLIVEIILYIILLRGMVDLVEKDRKKTSKKNEDKKGGN